MTSKLGAFQALPPVLKWIIIILAILIAIILLVLFVRFLLKAANKSGLLSFIAAKIPFLQPLLQGVGTAKKMQNDVEKAAGGAASPQEKSAAHAAPGGGKGKENAAQEISTPNIITLKNTFRSLNAILKNGVKSDIEDDFPWYLILGKGGENDDFLLKTGLHFPFGDYREIRDLHNPYFKIHILDKAVFFDIKEHFFLPEKNASYKKSGFDKILNQVYQQRPTRPVAGIVLKIPLDELALQDGESLAGREVRLKVLQDSYFRGLYYTQSIFGFVLPVYIVLTGAESIYGYKRFVDDTAKLSTKQVLGWSNPHDIDAAFSPQWFVEIKEQLNHMILSHVSESFSGSYSFTDPNELFLFSYELEKALSRLEDFISSLFRQTMHYKPFYFRGLYLCGDGVSEYAQFPSEVDFDSSLIEDMGFHYKLKNMGPYSDSGKKDATRSYFKQVIEDKIIAESSLAEPVRDVFSKKNYQRLSSQGLFSVIVAGSAFALYTGYSSLHANVQNLDLIINKFAKLANEKEESKKDRIGSNNKVQISQVNDVMTGFVIINKENLRERCLVASWFSNIDHKLHVLNAQFYKVFIVAPIKGSLQNKLTNILNVDFSKKNNFTSEIENYRAELDRTYDNLDTFTKDISAYYDRINDFNKMGEEYSPQKIVDMLQYIFEIDMDNVLPEDKMDIDFLNESIEFPKIDLAEYHNDVNDKFSIGSNYLIALISNDLYFKNIAEGIIDIVDRKNIAKNAFEDDLRGTVKKLTFLLNEISEIVSNKGILNHVINTDGNELRIDKIVKTLHDSEFFGAKFATDFEASVNAALVNRNKKFPDYLSSEVGPLLTRKEVKDPFVLDKGFSAINAQLLSLKDQSFIKVLSANDLNPNFDLGSAGKYWDSDILEDTVKLINLQKVYMEGALKAFPFSLQKYMQQYGNFGLGYQIMTSLVESRSKGRLPTQQTLFNSSSVPGSITEDSVLYLNSQLSSLVAIAQALKAINIENFDAIFRSLLLQEIGEAFVFLERSLRERGLYSIKLGDFSWWDGNTTPVYEAFGVRDTLELREYSVEQQSIIRHYAYDLAKPLLNAMTTLGIFSDTLYKSSFTFWDRLVAELDNKEGDSSATQLENLILRVLPTVTGDNCLSVVAANRQDKNTGDYFFLRRINILSQLEQRCHKNIENAFLLQYNSLAQFFNEQIANFFPFSASTPQEGEQEVDPESLRGFFSSLDKLTASLRGVSDTSFIKTPRWSDASEFLRNMNTLRDFFSSFVGSEKQGPTQDLNLIVEFRTNRKQETNASGIVEWTFSAGNKQISSLRNEKNITWSYGDPVTLSLRWAKDYPIKPVIDERNSSLKILEKTASYVSNTQWALFQLLKLHGGRNSALRKQQTLSFSTPIVDSLKSGIGGVSTATEFANCFIDVSFLSADKRLTLSVPPFPRKAPIVTLK